LYPVPAVLRDKHDVRSAMESIVAAATGYNGFNLVAGDPVHAAIASNRTSHVQPLAAGLHGVSNAQFDTPWPKLARTKTGVAEWTARGNDDVRMLFDVLADRTPADDDELPDTGLTHERERLLSAPFIVSADYGTRCSTLLAVSRDGLVHFAERSFDAGARTTGEVEEQFRIERT
jgi:uncharacterized protein with NRDE domain